MSRSTFNQIVIDCVPFLYSRPTYSLKSARFRYLRGKVVMATLVRYLAIQSDQHTLGKEFGVRQTLLHFIYFNTLITNYVTCCFSI